MAEHAAPKAPTYTCVGCREEHRVAGDRVSALIFLNGETAYNWRTLFDPQSSSEHGEQSGYNTVVLCKGAYYGILQVGATYMETDLHTSAVVVANTAYTSGTGFSDHDSRKFYLSSTAFKRLFGPVYDRLEAVSKYLGSAAAARMDTPADVIPPALATSVPS